MNLFDKYDITTALDNPVWTRQYSRLDCTEKQLVPDIKTLLDRYKRGTLEVSQHRTDAQPIYTCDSVNADDPNSVAADLDDTDFRPVKDFRSADPLLKHQVRKLNASKIKELREQERTYKDQLKEAAEQSPPRSEAASAEPA